VSTNWNNKFEIVMRPLRDRSGPQTTITIETRTAAQAAREATKRHPDMKVIEVNRITPTVASIRNAQRGETQNTNQPANEVVPLRRVSGGGS
jgi:hypothetical protein